MSNIIKLTVTLQKLFIAIFLVVGMFVAIGSVSSASAHEYVDEAYMGSGLRHAFAPKRDTETGEVVTRINNWGDSRYSGYVCAQETLSTGRVHHIGCVWVNLEPIRNGGGNGSIQLGVPAYYGSKVTYTYQSAPNVWRSISPAL